MVDLTDQAVRDYLIDLCSKVAAGVCGDYPLVEVDDIRQALVLFVYKNQGSLKMKEDGGNPRLILNKVARMLCNQERAEQMHESAQYHYRPSDVRKSLETYFATCDSTLTYVPEDAISDSGNDAIEVASDLLFAFHKLNEEDREALVDRYYKGIIPDNSSYARKRLDKATRRLTEIMNRYRNRVAEGAVGQRRVISNARANVLIHQEW
jgi:hypothetical protein